MTLAPLAESRVRQIISEEILRENVELIAESKDLFEQKGDSTTKAVQFVGEAAVELLKSKEGRQLLAGAMRLPLVLTKYYEKAIGFIPAAGADLIGAKKGGFLRKMIGGMTWLGSAPLKLAAVPLAKMANWVADMDDDTAKFLASGIEGASAAEQGGEDEAPSGEDAPADGAADEPESVEEPEPVEEPVEDEEEK